MPNLLEIGLVVLDKVIEYEKITTTTTPTDKTNVETCCLFLSTWRKHLLPVFLRKGKEKVDPSSLMLQDIIHINSLGKLIIAVYYIDNTSFYVLPDYPLLVFIKLMIQIFIRCFLFREQVNLKEDCKHQYTLLILRAQSDPC